ncbi:hypothetical protein ILYODFUR_014131 [Ilyodon furcidens]|uniref:Uncharacterized protein n=1 Tax=Ilyodon furcidens TaxID=33524 RepID=A0ABV0V5S5_9TELE
MTVLTLELRKHSELTLDRKAPKNRRWMSSSVDSVPLHSSCRLKCKLYFYLKRGLWTTEQLSSSFSSKPRIESSDVVSGSGVTEHKECNIALVLDMALYGDS